MMPVLVAGGAIARRALEQQRSMAFLARHDGVAPDQRKSRDGVIEGRYSAPTRISVTLRAATAELAFVRVILSVTRHTARRQLVAIEIARVAGIALDLRMRGSQWKSCRLVMIEANGAPLALVVAAFALGAVPSGVDILNPVAIHTCGAEVLVAFANMARGTGDAAMRPLQPELGPVMVERLDATPCRLVMTIVAGFSKPPLVRIVRLVTVEAAAGGIAELYRLHVTIAAARGLVCIPELEIRECVIERLAVQLDDVGFSPRVIGMTSVAFLLPRIRLAPVKPPARGTFRGNVFVAPKAETGLRAS